MDYITKNAFIMYKAYLNFKPSTENNIHFNLYHCCQTSVPAVRADRPKTKTKKIQKIKIPFHQFGSFELHFRNLTSDLFAINDQPK